MCFVLRILPFFNVSNFIMGNTRHYILPSSVACSFIWYSNMSIPWYKSVSSLFASSV